ncbi:sulfotransferase [Oceanibium sediminis]|uniref:sulfotransferase n=1 Tax=Oceanibium sediminis TaxID=2026339 RepID=UPI000DD39281|nr:sulfotransferase [Oceanibium sediminis]
MADPTLLFVIGAPKAGTTWLYDYLASHPECHLRGVKELHYFDTAAGTSRLEHYIEHMDSRAKDLDRKIAKAGFLQRRRLEAEKRDVRDWQAVLRAQENGQGQGHRAYLDYMTKGLGRAKLIADITPCYVTLTREHFAEMAALGDDVRFVFLLRDPVDRAWSQARMNGQRRARQTKRPVEAVVKRNFDNFLDGDLNGFAARSDYARTLTELSAAVPGARIHVEFYEQLFTEPALQRLTAFLGIAPHPGAFDSVSHAGRAIPLDAERRARAEARLRDQYAFCNTYFNGQLPDRWRAHMAEA